MVPKAELYEAIYGKTDGKADDDRPYERQLSDHKRKILAQVSKTVKQHKTRAIPVQEIKNLIVVKRRIGYRLNLDPDQIEIHG